LMHFSSAFNPNVSKEEGKQFEKILIDKGLDKLIALFPDRLKNEVTNNSANISLGQKQIINFVRVILRSPSFLILDEATANLDTITEKLLQEILDKLPKDTTKVIIAHRLNTIKNVDQIFQVGGGRVEIMKI
jgi:ATP-binding cassette, subfamily B, bacterial